MAIEPSVTIEANLKNLNSLQEVEGMKLHCLFHPSLCYSPLFQTPLFVIVINPAWS